MERPIFYIILIMLSHLITIFATGNESNIDTSTEKVDNTTKKISLKSYKAESKPVRKESYDFGPTTDTEIDSGTTESAENIQVVDGAENPEQKLDAAENKLTFADNNGWTKKEHEESLYQPIYSLENLDYFLRHPDKISPNFNLIRSDYLPNNIYNTHNSLQSNILELLRNFIPVPSFSSKFPHESIETANPKSKSPLDIIAALDRFKNDPIFTESKIHKIILDFLKKPSLLSDFPEILTNPSEFFRISSQDDIPEWNLQRHKPLKQFSNNVNYKNVPLTDGSHDKGVPKVYNIQQVSFVSSRGSRLPQDIHQVNNDFLHNISEPLEPKILNIYTTLFERLVNAHPFENLPPLQHHSTYSNLFQQQPLAPESSPSLDEDDYLTHPGDQAHFKNAPEVSKQPDNLDDIFSSIFNNIFSSFIDNNGLYSVKSENPKGNDGVPQNTVPSKDTSPLVEQYQLTNVPLLELTTSRSKDILQFENLPSNNKVSSLVDSSLVFGNDSLKGKIPTLGNISLSGENSQSEAGKSTDFSSLLENTPSDQTKVFDFFSIVPYHPGALTSANNVLVDKSVSSSVNTLSPSKKKFFELTKNTETPSSHSLIFQNILLFNKTQSPENIKIYNTHNVSPEHNFTSDNLSLFKSVPNSEGSPNKSTAVYMPPFFSTGIKEHIKKLKDPKYKNAQIWQTKTNAEEKVAQVSNTQQEKNPDCLKGLEWISKCHQCTCSDDGFPNCKIIRHCVLPPLGKPMLCKPYTSFEMGKCNFCTCSGDGLPICKFTDCYLHGYVKTEKLIPIRTSSKRTEKIEEKSNRNDDSSEVLRSDDSDIDGKNNSGSGNTKSKFNFDDEDFDTGNDYGHRRVGKRRSKEASDSQRCEVGSVWEINCFNCVCGLNGLPSCDKMAHCSLLPYGKPPRCKPTTVFENRCGGICKCDDEGETWCEAC